MLLHVHHVGDAVSTHLLPHHQVAALLGAHICHCVYGDPILALVPDPWNPSSRNNALLT